MEHPARTAEPEFFPEGARVAVVTDGGLDRLLDYAAPPGGIRVGALFEGSLRIEAPDHLRLESTELDVGELAPGERAEFEVVITEFDDANAPEQTMLAFTRATQTVRAPDAAAPAWEPRAAPAAPAGPTRAGTAHARQ
jgi:hypothetical protein